MKRGSLSSGGMFRKGLWKGKLNGDTEGEKELDMEKEKSVPGRGNCMCKGPEEGKNLVCSR